jgi:hypothetical protein
MRLEFTAMTRLKFRARMRLEFTAMTRLKFTARISDEAKIYNYDEAGIHSHKEMT